MSAIPIPLSGVGLRAAPDARLAARPVHLPAEAVLFHAHDQGGAWRLLSGCLRLDRVVGAERQLVQLALPGDWVGLETLCGEGYRLQAQALTPCVAEPLCEADVNSWTWAKAWLQQQHRHVQMTQLRTGKVASRLSHLLTLLDLPQDLPRSALAQQAAQIRLQLPPLRVLAEVIDAQPETVCRALSRLLPQRKRRSTTPLNLDSE